MLSYRKSQQVLLAEKLKIKNVIRVFGASGSGTTMARFCHSAFVRVATSVQTIYGNLTELCHSAFARVATTRTAIRKLKDSLCHSAFVRVATQNIKGNFPEVTSFATAHSCGLRLQKRVVLKHIINFATAHSCGLRLFRKVCKHIDFPLPQRIRAGCDKIYSQGQY